MLPLVALLAFGGCSTAPIEIGARQASQAMPIHPAPIGCEPRLARVVDSRDTELGGAFQGVPRISIEQAAEGIHGALLKAGWQQSENGSVIELLKITVRGKSTSKLLNVVLKEAVDPPRYYRGSVTRVNWFGSDGEFTRAYASAVADAVNQLTAAHCPAT